MNILYYKSINKVIYTPEKGYIKAEKEVTNPSTFSAKTKYLYFLSTLGYTILTASTKSQFLKEVEQSPVLIITNNRLSLYEVFEYNNTIPVLHIASNNYEISKIIETIKERQVSKAPLIFRRANDPIDTIFETIRFMIKSRSKEDLDINDKKTSEEKNIQTSK